ncbi:MAG TPA: cytochrome b/b6 domain-containing protein [Streptosporangiaceae bacterium]
MDTERTDRPAGPGDRADPEVVQRYSRPVRWFHAGVYVSVLLLLITGWWLLAGNEGKPSPLSRLFGTPDTTLHKDVGWALAALAVAGIALGPRVVRTFVVESLRFRRPDGRWFIAWPAAILTGRFSRHEGHFDPGQRIMNVLLTLGLVILVGSGIGLVEVHGGSAFVVFAKMHKWSTYAVTALLAGHILVAAGVLPGYRGVWRSMHFGGRLRAGVARRLWPGWFERAQSTETAHRGQSGIGRHKRTR